MYVQHDHDARYSVLYSVHMSRKNIATYISPLADLVWYRYWNWYYHSSCGDDCSSCGDNCSSCAKRQVPKATLWVRFPPLHPDNVNRKKEKLLGGGAAVRTKKKKITPPIATVVEP